MPTALPTTPTIEQALRTIAENSDNAGGTSLTKLVVPAIIGGLFAWVIAAWNRRRDHRQKGTEAARGEVFSVLGAVDETRNAISQAGASDSTLWGYGVEITLARNEAKQTGAPVSIGPKLDVTASELRELAQVFSDRLHRLKQAATKLGMVKGVPDEVNDSLAKLIHAYDVAAIWVSELLVYPTIDADPSMPFEASGLGAFHDAIADRVAEADGAYSEFTSKTKAFLIR